MTEAHLISRFLLWLPDAGAPPPARLDVFAHVEGLHIVHRQGFWLAADSAGSAPWLDVPMGKRLAGRLVSGSDIDSLCATADVQMQLYTLIHWNGQSLHLCSDPAGFKPVYRAAYAGGTLIATRLTDIVLVDPSLILPLDRIGLHSLFMMRGVYGDRTLHVAVKRLRAGTGLGWSATTGLTETRARRLRYPALDPGMSSASLGAEADRSLGVAITSRLADARSPISLALSGGYDSRIILAKARAMGVDVRCLTFGRAWHEDVRLAKRVARAATAPLQLLPMRSDETLRTLRQRTALYEGCTDIMIGQTALLADGVFEDGAALLHGFTGDVCNGGTVERLPAAAFASHDALAAGFMQHFTKQNVDATPLFGFAFDDAALQADLRADLDDSQSPLQAALLCWIENHNRRFVFAHVWCLGQRLDVIAPLYDAGYFAAWGAAPRALLEHRLGFKAWLAKSYPAFAKIPHPGAGIALPSLGEQLRAFAGDLPRWLSQRLLGDKRSQAWLAATGLGPETYAFDNLLTNDLQQQAGQLWEELSPHLSVLGLSPLPGVWAGLLGKPMPRRLLLTVAAYADHLVTSLQKHQRQQR
jgi:Asparagine synthase